jgi:hypothetical protein
MNLALDFLFILFYVLLLWVGCRLSQQSLKNKLEGHQLLWLGGVGCVLGWAQILTGFFDVIENFLLVREIYLWKLQGYSINATLPAAWPIMVVATIKFVLFFTGLAYCALGFFASSSYQRYYAGAGAVWLVFRLIWPSILLPLGVTLFLATEGQTTEVLRIFAQEAGTQETGGIVRLFCFIVASLYLAIIAWLCARSLLKKYVVEFPRQGTGGYVVKWLPRICAVTPLLIICRAFCVAKQPVKSGQQYHEQAPYLIANLNSLGWFFFILAVVTFLFVTFRRLRNRLEQNTSLLKGIKKELLQPEFISTKTDGANDALGQQKIGIDQEGFSPRWIGWLIGLSVVPFITIVIVMSISRSQSAMFFGAAAVLIFAPATFIPLLTLLIRLREDTKVPLITLFLIMAVLFSKLNLHDNHEIRHSIDTSLPTKENAPIGTLFRQWLSKRPDISLYKNRPYPVFLVAAPGGATLSGYQTAITLAELEDRFPGFRNHVFAISGVSGGSVGAATYAGLCSWVELNHRKQPPRRFGWWTDKTDEILGRDMMSPVLGAGLYGETAQLFLPFPFRPKEINVLDRALPLEYGLEESWEAAFAGEEGVKYNPFDMPLRDIGQRGHFCKRGVPALFLNTTNAETGLRLALNSIPATEREFTRRNLRTLNDEHPDVSMKLSTAAFLSARFPLISPAGAIPDYSRSANPNNILRLSQKRYVDAGYFDNSGGATLVNVAEAIIKAKQAELTRKAKQAKLAQLRGNSKAKPGAGSDLPSFRVYVLNAYMDDYEAGPAAHPSETPPAGHEEISSIAGALIGTWVSRASTYMQLLQMLVQDCSYDASPSKSANDDAKSAIQPAMAPSGVIHLKFERGNAPLVLGWLLSEEARRNMKEQAATLVTRSEITTVSNQKVGLASPLSSNVLVVLPRATPTPVSTQPPCPPRVNSVENKVSANGCGP